jgi:hypothetical protein
MILLNEKMLSPIRTAVITAALISLLTISAVAGQHYDVAGADTYRVGTALGTTRITYQGEESLSVIADRSGHRYVADVDYTRADDTGSAEVHARFVQELLRDGTFEDRNDEDPDFLTILNQPFAIQLDTTTLRDLEHLHGMVPFEAESPLGGAKLSGYLRSAPSGEVNGRHAVGVRFVATGPMSGTLPEHPQVVLSGTMRMNGTAYYAASGALLLELDATLTIDGRLRSGANMVPVRIVYHRAIRAGDNDSSQ